MPHVPAWLKAGLREYAEWRHAVGGWPDSTTEWRAAHATGGGTPGPRIPVGVVPPPRIGRLAYAIQALMEEECHRSGVGAMVASYLHGQDRAAEMLGVGLRRLQELRLRGELSLLAYLQAVR